MSFENITE